MASKYSGGISWSLTAQDIIELLKDPNSVLYRAVQGFLMAVNEVAQDTALVVMQNAIKQCEASHTSRGVSVDVDKEVFSPNKLPSDLVQSAVLLPQKETMLDQKVKNLINELATCKAELKVSQETQLNQFNKTMDPKYQLTATQQKSLAQSYETVVAQTQNAIPAELTGKAREKLVGNRAAVGMEMKLMFELKILKPSEIKKMGKEDGLTIIEYIKAEQKNYAMIQDINRIETDLFSLRMTRGVVKSAAVAQNNLEETEESTLLSRMKNPFPTKPVPPK